MRAAMTSRINKIGRIITALPFAIGQAYAASNDYHYNDAGAFYQPVQIWRANCVVSTVDATTYSFANIPLNVPDDQEVDVVVGIFSLDALSNYNVTALSIEATTMTEVADAAGPNVTNIAWYRTAAPVSSSSSVNLNNLTFSEAITGAVVCTWAVDDRQSIVPVSSAAANVSSGAVLTLTLSTNKDGGYAFGVCGANATAGTATWAGLTEAEESGTSGEFDFSAADLKLTSATSVAISVTCDWSSTTPGSGVAESIR